MTNLQKIMNNQKITDHELSEKSGVHFNTIKLIRTGAFKQPRITTLRKLAKSVGIYTERNRRLGIWMRK